MPQWQRLFSALREQDVDVSERDMPLPVAGGDISAAWQITAADQSVFLKTGPLTAYDMFLAEADGLRELAHANALRVPKVLGCVASTNECLLALEWIDLELATPATEALLGQRLAKQHRHTAEQFGWKRDNTIGSTLQQNNWSDDWVQFYAERRLGYQLELAAKNGYTGVLQSEGLRLLDNLGYYFSNYWPEASLLHGDLWAGNWASSNGEPVVFDPAVYYGDRENDLAMTELFGGFTQTFYAAYDDAWPMSPGSDQRMLLYQLYYMLNHLNLFGASYLPRVERLFFELR